MASSPIFGSLSMVRRMPISGGPGARRAPPSSPESTFRLFTRTWNPSIPRPRRSSRASSMSSASATMLREPTMSASHWTNSRNRPRAGFSARHTGAIW